MPLVSVGMLPEREGIDRERSVAIRQTLVLRASATLAACSASGDCNIITRDDGKFGHALSAGIDQGKLARLATAVLEQIEHD